MPWYRYDGNLLSNDKTAVLRLLDKDNVKRDVPVGGTIELTSAQLDYIDDRHVFASVSGPGTTLAPIVEPRYLMVKSDGSLVDSSGTPYLLSGEVPEATSEVAGIAKLGVPGGAAKYESTRPPCDSTIALRALDLQAGEVVSTRGYWQSYDGGGQTYTVVNGTQDEDGGSVIVLANGRRALCEAGRRRVVDAAMFGAIGNDQDNPLSIRYSTLQKAQAVYPHASSLADTIDWAATQAAVAYIRSSRGVGSGQGGVVNLGASMHVWNRPVDTGYPNPITLKGLGTGEGPRAITQVRRQADSTMPLVITSSGSISGNVAAGMRTRPALEGILFRGNSFTDVGVVFTTSAGACMRDVNFMYWGGKALQMFQAFNAELYNVRSQLCGSGETHPVWTFEALPMGGGPGTNTVLMTNCQLERNSGSDIKITGGAAVVQVTNSKIEHSDTANPTLLIENSGGVHWTGGFLHRGKNPGSAAGDPPLLGPHVVQYGAAASPFRPNVFTGVNFSHDNNNGGPAYYIDQQSGSMIFSGCTFTGTPTDGYFNVAPSLGRNEHRIPGCTFQDPAAVYTAASGSRVPVDSTVVLPRLITNSTIGPTALGLRYPGNSIHEIVYVGTTVREPIAGVFSNSATGPGATSAFAFGNGTGVAKLFWVGQANAYIPTTEVGDTGIRITVGKFHMGNSSTKIVTFTADGKFALFGAPPVAKQGVAAAATDLASVITLANSIRAALGNYGAVS